MLNVYQEASMDDSAIKQPSYLAYLLRLWRVGNNSTWRASLENPHSGERQAFADLDLLVAFLKEKTGETLSGDAQSASQVFPQ